VKDALKVEFGLQDKPTLFADGLKELKLPEYVMDVVNEEKAKLFGLKPGNEFNKIKWVNLSYLNIINPNLG
jgi:Cu/Ag efflux protein CusF